MAAQPQKILLCASFGTSVPEARTSITAVENALRAAAPGYGFARAFTSPTIRRILAARGEEIFSLPEALDTLKASGAVEVVVQPMHLLYGIEYDKMAQTVAARQGDFVRLTLGKPLLAAPADRLRLAEALCAAYPRRPQTALVWMGHGTAHAANEVYPAVQEEFRRMGRTDVFVATVEGAPTLADLLPALTEGGFSAVRLVPLMLVAGDHALNDMAGNAPDSWKSVLEAAGYAVSCTLEGLGALPEVQALYCAHLRGLL